MLDVGTRAKNQPPPAPIVFEALAQPSRGPVRQWLVLQPDEQWPEILLAEEPHTVLWSSIWSPRPDARIRFDVEPSGGSTILRWTLSVAEPVPEPLFVRRMCHRLNELINAELRYTFGS